MPAYRDSKITKTALVLFFIMVVIYAYFEIRGLLYGPHIDIASSISTVQDQYVLINGNADHIAALTVNGAPVAVTTDGAFWVPYLLAPGANQIVFDARDSYGHKTSKTVQIVFVPTNPSTTTPTASTTTAMIASSTMTTIGHVTVPPPKQGFGSSTNPAAGH